MSVFGWFRFLVEGFLRIVARFYCLFVFDNATEIAKALALTFIVFPVRATRKQKRIKGQPNRHERTEKLREREFRIEMEMEMETTKCVKPKTDIF